MGIMAEIDNVVSTLVRGWARAEHDAGACPQSWESGARERLCIAMRAYGLAVDEDVERIAQIHWDGQWQSILRNAVLAARASRDPTWPPGHAVWAAHAARVQAAIDALDAFDASCQPRG